MDEHNDNQTSEEKTSSQLDELSDGVATSGGSHPPHEKQIRYWKLDLRYKLVSLVISVGGFILVVVGILATYQQISINTEQLRVNSAQSARVQKTMCANAQIAIINVVTNLDRAFVEKPKLRPYFYEGVAIDVKDDNYAEASATAEMALDVFDLVAGQSRDYTECWDSPVAWDEWIVDMFSTSPILRDTLDQHPNWYTDLLINMRKEGEKRLREKDAQKAKSQQDD